MTQQRTFTFDANMQLMDGGQNPMIASAACQVAGAAKILDLLGGASGTPGTGATVVGRDDFAVLVNVTAIDTTSADELYRLEVQGSTDIAFGSGNVQLGEIRLGASAVTFGSAADGVGLYEARVTNERAGTSYRYLRMFARISGTTPSISFKARLGKTGGI